MIKKNKKTCRTSSAAATATSAGSPIPIAGQGLMPPFLAAGACRKIFVSVEQSPINPQMKDTLDAPSGPSPSSTTVDAVVDAAATRVAALAGAIDAALLILIRIDCLTTLPGGNMYLQPFILTQRQSLNPPRKAGAVGGRRLLTGAAWSGEAGSTTCMSHRATAVAKTLSKRVARCMQW